MKGINSILFLAFCIFSTVAYGQQTRQEKDSNNVAYRGVPGKSPGDVPRTFIRHSLIGRTMIKCPDPKTAFKAETAGQVRLRITVNRAGIVSNPQVISAYDTFARDLAIEKTDSIRFNKSDTAPPEQFGIITFEFNAP
jgi:hypothetical protein